MAGDKKSGCSAEYQLTEQVFRQIAAGETSTVEIEKTLSQGYLIEEHKNEHRGDSQLLCVVWSSENGKRARHLMRSAADSPQQLILWTYQPNRPQWSTPVKRAGQEEQTVNADLGSCYFCGGDLKSILAGNYDFRLDGELYVIKKVPATLCEQCGEKYLSAEVAKNLEESVAAGAFTGVIQAYVMEYKVKGD